ncbi:hypothetical protein F4777DRAFT_432997 [Nemania sp. FL0916]|nr:hypothetical protein F4777DRAFT_432997 [Nemania sp. FL0916]
MVQAMYISAVQRSAVRCSLIESMRHVRAPATRLDYCGSSCCCCCCRCRFDAEKVAQHRQQQVPSQTTPHQKRRRPRLLAHLKCDEATVRPPGCSHYPFCLLLQRKYGRCAIRQRAAIPFQFPHILTYAILLSPPAWPAIIASLSVWLGAFTVIAVALLPLHRTSTTDTMIPCGTCEVRHRLSWPVWAYVCMRPSACKYGSRLRQKVLFSLGTPNAGDTAAGGGQRYALGQVGPALCHAADFFGHSKGVHAISQNSLSLHREMPIPKHASLRGHNEIRYVP